MDDVDQPAEPVVATGPGEPLEQVEPNAFDQLWARMARPFDVNATVSALVGLSPAVVAQLVGTVVASSDEAEALLDRFPSTVRSLATSLEAHAERCIGSLRGPVLWSETMSARASSFGDPDLFVCSAPSRAYDIDENQVLVAALLQVRDAGKAAADAAGERHADDPLLRTARRNGSDAGRFAEHPSLARVNRSRPKPRAIKRTRSGKHRKSYGPALAMLERAANPLDAAAVQGWCDERTRAQHRLLMGVVHRLEGKGGRLPDFRAERGALYAGPVQYYHPRTLGDPNRRRAEQQLAVRAGGRASMVVLNDADLDAAIERAIDLARSES